MQQEDNASVRFESIVFRMSFDTLQANVASISCIAETMNAFHMYRALPQAGMLQVFGSWHSHDKPVSAAMHLP